MEESKHKSRILYSAKLSSNNEGEIKTFSDHNEKKMEFITSRYSPQDMLIKVLQGEGKLCSHKLWST